MIDAQELNAQGVRVRQALDILRTVITEPQMALEVAYAYAVFSNLMRALEQDYDVFPGYFGSAGAALPEINPFDGVVMPPPVSLEAPPAFIRASPAEPAPDPPPEPPAP
jgi:hypothetical protein